MNLPPGEVKPVSALSSATDDTTVLMRRVAEMIDCAKSVLVTAHQDPDGDSVGAILAVSSYLRTLGKTVHFAQHGPTPANLRFLEGSDDITDSSQSATGELIPCDLVIALECPQPVRMGATQALIPPAVEIINIDHHKDNSFYGALNWVEPSASSVAEMVARYFEFVGWDYPKSVAVCLFTAILTDTGRFRFNSVSPTTLRMAANAISRGLDVQAITDSIYYSRSDASLRLTGAALSQTQFRRNGSIVLIPITLDAFQNCGAVKGDTEGLVEYTLMTGSAVVGAVLREEKSSFIKISLRSRGTHDVSLVAREFGGGGHRNAAGLVMTLPLDEVITIIGDKLEALLNG